MQYSVIHYHPLLHTGFNQPSYLNKDISLQALQTLCCMYNKMLTCYFTKGKTWIFSPDAICLLITDRLR